MRTQGTTLWVCPDSLLSDCRTPEAFNQPSFEASCSSPALLDSRSQQVLWNLSFTEPDLAMMLMSAD